MCATVVRSTVTHLRPALIAALTVGSLIAACSSSSAPSGPKTVTYFGVLGSSNGVHSGTVTLKILDDNSGGSGSFTVDGTDFAIGSVQVNGTQVTATGGGYTFDGVVSDPDITGTWDSGADHGIFTVLLDPTSQTAVAYCGTHIGTLSNGQPTGGTFMLIQSGTELRGLITSAGSPGLESAITGSVFFEFPGAASINLDPDHFDGTYTTGAGDNGDVEGHLCGTSGPGGTQFIGVVGDFPGTGTGTIGFTVGSSNATSSGSYNVGGTPVNFDAVIVGVGNQVVGFAGTAIFRGTIAGTSLDGTWYTGSTLNGLMAATQDQGNIVLYCGSNNATGAGAFAFALIGDPAQPRAIHGVYTGGVGNGFQGTVDGFEGDNAGTMSGQTGTVTVLPDVSSFGGFFDFSGGGGLSGTMTGVLCP